MDTEENWKENKFGEKEDTRSKYNISRGHSFRGEKEDEKHSTTLERNFREIQMQQSDQ